MVDKIDNVLEINDLKVRFNTEEGEIRAVDGVSFSIARGRIMALVGESGCGKSVTSYSILKLIQKPGKIAGGTILLIPKNHTPIDITSLAEKSDLLYKVRGGLVSMVFQEPMTALSPVHTVGDQITEAILLHQNISKEEAHRKALEMLKKVGIPGAEKRIKQYPFEMSGGMRQRIVIAMALCCNPELLIADEPTTALDVTIQAQIIGLMKELIKSMGTSILLITHDLGVVAQMADDVAVMYLGRVVEKGSVRTIIKNPRHPYTMGLLASIPGVHKHEKKRLSSIPGSVPSLTRIPQGCPFHPRCEFAEAGRCDTGSLPPLTETDPGRAVACFRALEIPSIKEKGVVCEE